MGLLMATGRFKHKRGDRFMPMNLTALTGRKILQRGRGLGALALGVGAAAARRRLRRRLRR